MASVSPSSSSLDNLTFDNRFVRQLPADPITENFCRQINDACYSSVLPTVVKKPTVVAYSTAMLQQLDLKVEETTTDRFAQVFSGNQLLSGMQPFAMCYGGHQFGHWAGQLGDGRAINLGEIINSQKQRWVLQLKGAGLTPYSRSADGLAVLRSSVREFLCSEAMYHLGIPTTRALSLVLTGETVIRDMFYNGNPQAEPGAIVCRVAPSFIRFGHFQMLAARGEIDLLRQFVDYTIQTDFPHLCGDKQTINRAIHLKWFAEVCKRTAIMIVHWQRVGFVHGVMNTDNMSIMGLTIDYGPYGWLDAYEPDWTPNTTDAAERRYRYSQQPEIALWNLVQLANAIYPLIDDVEPLQQALSTYNNTFHQGWQEMMAQKLGLKVFQVATDELLVDQLLALLAEVETDITIFFRNLAYLDIEKKIESFSDEQLLEPIKDAWYQPEQISSDYKTRLSSFLRSYLTRIQDEGRTQIDKKQQMDAVNPKYILRNYLSQLAIDKADQGDFSMIHELLEVMCSPYSEQPKYQHYADKRPDWARKKAGCSMLSCSS